MTGIRTAPQWQGPVSMATAPLVWPNSIWDLHLPNNPSEVATYPAYSQMISWSSFSATGLPVVLVGSDTFSSFSSL